MARGGIAGKRWPHINKLLREAGVSFEHDFTEGVGHGIELAREAVAKGYELVIAVGGDGTVSEVVNGIVDEEGKGRAILGIVITGVGNDIVRTLGIPRDYANACRVFSDFKTATIDLGVAEYMRGDERVRRFFINTAGLGFDAAVVERTLGRNKAIKGVIPYAFSLLLALAAYRNKDVVINLDGAAKEERAFLVVVNNGRYFARGMKITPDADPCDGFLDALIMGDLGRLAVLRNLPKVYKGTHITHPKLRLCPVKSIEVDTKERMLLQVDGELLGQAPASFQVLPAALTVAIPYDSPLPRLG
jgi:YegS/Rv2252/BmrU family lipid kinase